MITKTFVPAATVTGTENVPSAAAFPLNNAVVLLLSVATSATSIRELGVAVPTTFTVPLAAVLSAGAVT
ncbi:MAG TPA: hypothetical protein VN738_09910, partial [Acidothermaceae bacterium]|nr:hypothetical protein [Acidothermaceae bacterium]